MENKPKLRRGQHQPFGKIISNLASMNNLLQKLAKQIIFENRQAFMM